MLQNLQVIRLFSLIFFSLNLFIRLISLFYISDLKSFKNNQEYNLLNWAHLLILPLFFFLSEYLMTAYQQRVKRTVVWTRVFTLIFGIYLVMSGMLTSFIAMHNPRSNLTFYMVSLIITSTMLVFEVQEVLILIAFIETAFYSLLKFTQTIDANFIYNQFASIALLTMFYFICWYTYAYKIRNFLQLAQIEQNNAELQKAGNFKSEVLGMVAHDLRNPIAAIESIASLMQMDEVDEETEENLTMIKASCIKAREIVNELLEAARDESDSELMTTRVNVNSLLEGLVKEWKNHSISNEITFFTDVRNVYAKINTEKFHRVMDNLISNAIKFSNDHSKIEVFLKANKQQVLIEVKDFGVGIPQHLLPYIFDRFSKSGREGLRGERSTGLGLNIARRIVEKHGGTMEATSEENRGSVFHICLPNADASFTN